MSHAGVMERTIFIMRSALILAFLASTALADDFPFEQVLVPFDTMRVAGVGTIWSAELRVRNDGDQAVNLFPETCFGLGGPFPCDRRIDVPAHTTKLIDLLDDRIFTTPAGVMLYVPKGRGADISFNLRVGALGDPVGVEIPVVREGNYRRGPTTLLHVPLGAAGVRPTMRIYTPVPFNREIAVRVYREADDVLIYQRTFQFQFPTDPVGPAALPSLFDVSVALADAGLQKPGFARVVIESDPPSMPYWPLLTITDNATQRVMSITPQ